VVGPILWLVLGATLSLLVLILLVRRRPHAARENAGAGQPEILGGALDPDQPRAPERLGPYLLIDRIGEGGLAEVFTAAAHEPDGSIRPLVIKRLRSDRAQDTLAITHFLAEKELGAALAHPNIAAVVDFGEAAGQRFLVEEYIPGRDVGRLTRRMVELKQRPLSASAILYVAHEVLSALEYAHARLDPDGEPLDLVHRDVTPENILISERGEVKLLDFGIAQIRGCSGGSDQPEGETVKGNVDFMSPEQARGGTVDHRADLFSVGLVMYFCAARAPLYRGKTLYDRLLAAATGPGEREWDFIAGLPPPLPDLLPGLLAPEPGDRFHTAGQARAMMAPHCVGAPAELAEAIRRLFGDDLQRERTRLQLALGPARRRVHTAADRLAPVRP
jgi:eukaryotic-like serine/threonine-protein kinase